MVYLREFNLISEYSEYNIIRNKKNIFNTLYPLNIFPEKEFNRITFEPITIFYGGNGSGKTTLLNIISSKLDASRRNINNIGEIFDQYVELTNYELERMSECKEIKFISSDDVFDFLLDIRAINSNVNRRKGELSVEYLKSKFGGKSIGEFKIYLNDDRKINKILFCTDMKIKFRNIDGFKID